MISHHLETLHCTVGFDNSPYVLLSNAIHLPGTPTHLNILPFFLAYHVPPSVASAASNGAKLSRSWPDDYRSTLSHHTASALAVAELEKQRVEVGNSNCRNLLLQHK